eukprot:TRINITY_DN18699_c0_g1_i2.p2 TRINITY_DN18699_c0_g1~~TRINITY_DN18699_c0_g1_i2.p2  ORF type:complete len:172 (+),score=12.14 TRINITY_DN18699_c0_g1_i2:346-861(+)
MAQWQEPLTHSSLECVSPSQGRSPHSLLKAGGSALSSATEGVGVLDWVGVDEGVTVGLTVAVGVRDPLAEAERVGGLEEEGEGLDEALRVWEEVKVLFVSVALAERVRVAVEVGVEVNVSVGSFVALRVGLCDCEAVLVGVRVAVTVRVCDRVGVNDNVLEGSVETDWLSV